MSELKHQVNKVADDLKDAADEVKHCTLAEVEKAKREALAREMGTGDKMKSVGSEIGHRTAAEIDKTKRVIRDKT